MSFFFGGGKVAFDVVGLGVGPPCLRVDSEETLQTLTDERAQLARAAPGVTPVDSSEMGATVRELIWPSVLGEPQVDCLQEPMPGEKSLAYAIQATASVWMPFEQVHNVVSGDADIDSFGMAPWDDGGMHSRTCREAIRTMMLQWLMQLLCRPVIMHGLDRTMTMNTENGLDTIMMITTDSPRLAVTPGEWYASVMLTLLSCDLRQMNSTMLNSRTELGFPQVDSAAADSGAVEMDDLIFRRLSLPPEDVSAGRDGNYGSFKIDSASVDYGTGPVELDDMIFSRLSFPPEEFATGWDDMIFRHTNLPPDEFSAGRNGDYIWRDLWTRPSVCNRPVTGSHGFGSFQRLGRCCLWLAALSVR